MSLEVLTVSALNNRASEVLQKSFPLLWVVGEISNLTRATSGHIYFSLKDHAAQVRCVMFRNRAQLVAWRLENGQQVEVQALVALYAARGDFQLNVEGMRRAGMGVLYEAYLRLREQLDREGLFAAENKLPVPRLPRRVCIISSPQAAALRDILITLRRRAPCLQVALYPVPVQGEGAAAKIAAAVALAGARAAQDSIDVVVLARGGGSIEDLWPFNDEAVARAIAACPLPILSGIGHETDTCIADLVADQRAATPTAAAELLSAGWFAATEQLHSLGNTLQRCLRSALESRMQHLDLLAHRLVHPGRKLALNRLATAHLATRLHAALGKRLRHGAIALERFHLRLSQARPRTQPAQGRLALGRQRLISAVKCRLTAQRAQLETLAATLAQLSPQATLERGYSIVRDKDGRIVLSSRQLAAGDAIELHFAFGRANALVGTASESK